MRVLFLTHRLPYAPDRGDRARAFHMVRLLAPHVDLEVMSLVHDAREAAQMDRVRELGARVSGFKVPYWLNRLRALPHLAGSRPLTHLLLDAPGLTAAIEQVVRERPPDVVLAYCSSMARFAVTGPLANYPLVVDLVDVDSAKWAALSVSASWPMRWIYAREARYLGDFERLAAMRAHRTVVVNAREAALLRALAPDAAIDILPSGVDLSVFEPVSPPGDAPHVVFCGVMNYLPNVEGVLWFSRDVWPLVRARRPDARFFVVGSDPVDSVRRLNEHDGITVTGRVPEVQSYLWNAAVSVAPLKTARGVQNKVLEAVAAGLPAVVTRPVYDGLPQEIVVACRVADAPAEFAAQVLALLDMPASARRTLAQGANLDSLRWDRQLAPLAGMLSDAASARGARSSSASARVSEAGRAAAGR